jgi:hypothetical protein
MKRIVKYELTSKEKELLKDCASMVARNCDCDCQEGCPFYLEKEDMCILEKLEDIVNNCD